MAQSSSRSTEFDRTLGEAKKQAGNVASAFSEAAHDVYGQARESAADVAGTANEAARTTMGSFEKAVRNASACRCVMPQLETGKINCVRLPHYGRLPPGGLFTNA